MTRLMRYVRIAVLVGAALLLLGTDSARAAMWKFLVYGDSRGNGTDPGTNNDNSVDTVILGELAAETVKERAAFVLFLGDLVSSGSVSHFNTWKNTMQPVYDAGIGVCSVAGNHEIRDLDDFKSMFITPLLTAPFAGCQNVVVDSSSADGRSYSFQYGGAMFLGLDNYADASTKCHKVNQDFVDARLAARNAATTPLVFVFAHEPAFKAGKDSSLETFPTQRNAFWNSLKAAGCRAFFAGHDHIYAHARLHDKPEDGNPNNDIHQFVVGMAGAPLYETDYSGDTGVWTVDSICYDDTHFGYVRVVVDETAHKVTQTWVQRTGPNTFVNTTDVFTYSYTAVPKPAGANLHITSVPP